MDRLAFWRSPLSTCMGRVERQAAPIGSSGFAAAGTLESGRVQLLGCQAFNHCCLNCFPIKAKSGTWRGEGYFVTLIKFYVQVVETCLSVQKVARKTGSQDEETPLEIMLLEVDTIQLCFLMVPLLGFKERGMLRSNCRHNESV